MNDPSSDPCTTEAEMVERIKYALEAPRLAPYPSHWSISLQSSRVLLMTFDNGPMFLVTVEKCE